MGTTKLFATFYSNFARITSMLPYNEHTLMDDLKDRLVQQLQDALALCGFDFEDMTSLKAYLQRTDKAQHSLYLQQQNNCKESSPATSKSKDLANLSQTTTATRPTLAAVPAVPVTWSNSSPRTTTNTTAAEREQLQAQGRCFLCKQVGHMSVACPNNREGQTPSAGQIQELDVIKSSKNA